VENLSRSNQSPRSIQPGHSSVERRSEYRPDGGDALWLRNKGRYGLCLVTWSLSRLSVATKRYMNVRLLHFTLLYRQLA